MLSLPRKVKIILGFSLICGFTGFQANEQVDWPEYLGGPDRNHYSELTQIYPSNANELKVAWTYALPDSGQMQANPIIIALRTIRFGATSNNYFLNGLL